MSTLTRILLILAVVGAAVIAIGSRHVNEDLFLSLAAGRDIVQGHLTTPEFRSFTAEGLVWVNQAWLSHLLYFLSFQALGPLGPVLIKVTLLIGCLALVFLRCRALGVTIELSLVGLWVGLIAATPFLGNRPENFGVFFLLLFSPLLTLTRVPRLIRLPAVPLVLALWSNCHGSFMLGIGLLGLKVALETIRCIFPQILKPEEGAPRRNAVEWWCLLAAGLLAVVVGSPFGTDNLLMPFRQLGTSGVTAHSRDWLPLWSFQSGGLGLLAGGNVSAYLVMLGTAALALAAMLRRRLTARFHTYAYESEAPSPALPVHGEGELPPVDGGIRGGSCRNDHSGRSKPGIRNTRPYLRNGALGKAQSALRNAEVRTEVVIEVLIVLVTLVFALRFRRMILFSAFSLVPLASFVWQYVLSSRSQEGSVGSSESDRRRLTARFHKYGDEPEVPTPALPVHEEEEPPPVDGGIRGGAFDDDRSGQSKPSILNTRPQLRKHAISACIGAALLCMVTAVVCYRAALFPYFPGNPFRPERSAVRELMSFDSFSPSLVEFLRRNKIDGRVLSGWEISPYLMLHLPELRLFMDCRDQSLYPDKVIRDYFTILGVLPGSSRRRLSLLDAYRVSALVLTTEPTDFDCAVYLMNTKKWACIYADENSLVLLRADSEPIRKSLESNDWGGMWYPDAETKALSRAYLTHFMLGGIPRTLASRLRSLAREKPVPNYYGFISSGIDNDSGCFKPETVRYFMNEATRLTSVADHLSRRGRLALESLERIYEIMEANAVRCGAADAAVRFEMLRNSVRSENEALRNRYLGILF